jgi:predicted DNA-binding protein (MmcQ/YjbR family)
VDAHVPQRARLGGLSVPPARPNKASAKKARPNEAPKKQAPKKQAPKKQAPKKQAPKKQAPKKQAVERTSQKAPRGAAAELALSKFALEFPSAVEEFPWGHRVAKVNKKIFVTFGNDEGAFSMSAKLPRSAEIALTLPFAEPTGYGLGKSGWVTARFAANETPPLDMMRAWIDESYRAIAPAKLVTKTSPAKSGRGRPRR